MTRFRALMFVSVLALLGLGGPRASATAQDGPGLGTPVSISLDGEEIAQITVTEFEEPFEDYEPSSAPPDGFHWALAHVEVELNDAGLNPSSFGYVAAVASDGSNRAVTDIDRAEDLEAAEPDLLTFEGIESGETARGVLVFQVQDGTAVTRIEYSTFSTTTVLADLTVDGTAPSTDGSAATPAVEVSAEDCAGVAAWRDEVGDEFAVFEDAVNTLFTDESVPVRILDEAVADIETAAANIRASDRPAVIDDAATGVADGLDAYAAAVRAAGEAVGTGEDIQRDEFLDALDTAEAVALFADGLAVLDPIDAACGGGA